MSNLRLTARSEWNFTSFWYATKVAQSVTYFAVKKQGTSCMIYRGVEFGMKSGNQNANINRKNHYMHND
jgi:hypothetical protein